MYFTAATITPATMNVYTFDEHTISCNLKDIPNKMGVNWSPTNGPINSYYSNDGSLVDLAQTSTLRITSSRLRALKGSSRTHTFTCKITVGNSNSAITATQTVTLFTPTASPSKCLVCYTRFVS